MRENIVNTKYGKIKGYEKNGMLQYLGIPYAKPPVGELRFKRAVEIEPWEEIYDAKEYGPKSMQLEEGKVVGSEDCLTINVQRPLTGENLPVLVWIHGGGYNTGAASDSLTDGHAFVEDGICFVSLQYRLNVLGFFDFSTYEGCEDFDTNCGFSDQLMALKWVHENIASFGGDPENVTIMGESAGASSVVNMLAAPLAKGLFQKAVIESALPNCVMTHEMSRENMELFLEGMGMTEEDLPSLKTMNPEEFQKGNSYVAVKHQYKNPGMFLPGPVQDDLLPVRPLDAIKAGSAAGVKVIIGTNRHEGTMFVHEENTGFPNSWEMVETMFANNKGESYVDGIEGYYQQFKEDSFIEFATDYAFQMPSIKLANYQRKYNDVWMYRFELVTKFGEKSGMRASHAFELPGVFKDRDFPFTKMELEDESEETIEKFFEDVHTPWSKFIQEKTPVLENWPLYEGEGSKIRIIDRDTRTESLDRSEMMNLWQDLRFYED